jgi:hypothetical protein
MYTHYDKSYKLSGACVIKINTKEKLFEVLRDYLLKLFNHHSEDSKLFWATYSMFVIRNDRICFCSYMGTLDPLCYVDVRKSNKTNINVVHNEIDQYTGTNSWYNLKRIIRLSKNFDKKRAKYKYVSPLEILGLEYDPDQNWTGDVLTKKNITGWNIIEADIDKKTIIKNESVLTHKSEKMFETESIELDKLRNNQSVINKLLTILNKYTSDTKYTHQETM